MPWDKFAKLTKWRKVAYACGFVLALLVVVVSSIGIYLWAQYKETEQISQFMMTYYQKPDPDKVVDMIFRAERAGLLDKPEVCPPLGGFLVGVFSKNPDKLESWFDKFSALQQKHHALVLYSLWYVGTPESKALLRKIADKAEDPDRKIIEPLLKKEPLVFEKAPLNEALLLDILWSEFFATGDEKYVKRITEAISFDTKESGNQILISAMAKWSLRSNAETHPKVREIYRALQEKHPELKDPPSRAQ